MRDVHGVPGPGLSALHKASLFISRPPPRHRAQSLGNLTHTCGSCSGDRTPGVVSEDKTRTKSRETGTECRRRASPRPHGAPLSPGLSSPHPPRAPGGPSEGQLCLAGQPSPRLPASPPPSHSARPLPAWTGIPFLTRLQAPGSGLHQELRPGSPTCSPGGAQQHFLSPEAFVVALGAPHSRSLPLDNAW